MKTLQITITLIVCAFVVTLNSHQVFAQTSQYDFQVWPADPWEPPGYWEKIQGKICPTPIPDANTSPLVKTYFGISGWQAKTENISQIVKVSNTIPSCDNPLDITSIRPNFTDTAYPVYSIAQWTQNGVIHTVQSNNTKFLSIGICEPAYGMDFERKTYHPGDIVSIKIRSSESGCMHLPTNATISVYNSTENYVPENVLYIQSIQIINETWFNYTVPEFTDKFGLLHISVKLTYPYSDGNQVTQESHFLSSDTKKSLLYNAENLNTWIRPSSVVNGSRPFIAANICPFAPATDENLEEEKDPITGIITNPGSYILLNYNMTMPDGSQKLVQGKLGSFDNCENSWDSQTINANMIGNWSVHVTAQRIGNGTLHKLDSQPMQLEVRKPIFQSSNIEKLDVTNITNISHVPSESKPRFDVMDWSENGKFLLLNYRDYQDNPNSYILHLATMDLENYNLTKIDPPIPNYESAILNDAKLSTDGKSLYLVSGQNLYLYNMTDKTVVQLTKNDYIRKIQVLNDDNLALLQDQGNQNGTNIKFIIWLASTNGTKLKNLFQAENVDSFNLNRDGNMLALVVTKGATCEYCAYAQAQVVDLDTKQISTMPEIFNPAEGKWSPGGDLVVWHSGGGIRVPGGSLVITDRTGGFQETLFAGYDNPTSFVISHDGKSVIYGLDRMSCCAEASELYKLDFAKEVPEFPLSGIILAISISVLLGFYKIKRNSAPVF